MAALLEFRQVSKAFGPVMANKDVSFSVEPGSIHALVGENGAGKSTIVKILFGMYRKDSGEILFRGQPVDFSSPLIAKKKGLGMVHQHFMLAGPLSALDHIFLDEPAHNHFLSLLKPLAKRNKRAELEKLSLQYQMPVPWDECIEELSVGIQQRIEILKLLHNKADVLILDEPTAVLTPQEVQALFTQLRELRKAGKTILLITHKLKEVMSLADSVTVFRQGQVVVTKPVSQTSPVELSELMVGRKLKEFAAPSKSPSKQVALELKNLSDKKKGLKELDLKVHQGEIVGIAGVEGNGQSELIDILLHPRKHKEIQGDIQWMGASLKMESAGSLKKKGFSYFPQDRLHQGVLTSATATENFILGQQYDTHFQRHHWMKWESARAITEAQMKDFDVRPANPDLRFQNFSGGNQQKLVVARELYRRPSFLLAAQPTRGVDIGAIERIHSEMIKLRDQQACILLISSDLDELMKLSDRIVVIFQGRFLGELKRENFD